jgi:predicted nucleotidyltransferase
MLNLSIRKNTITSDHEFNTGLLKPKDTLFPKFWSQGTLNPVVARKLMAIADEIVKSLDLDIEVEDIIITGSIASYNWHELSDIDLHILLDFEKVDDNFDLVKRMLDQTRINWNKKHDIRIAGKEVELYFQHYTEPHEANGIWSLELEKWIAKPEKMNPEIDIKTTEKKAEALAQSVEHLYELHQEKNYKEAYEYAGKIKTKIAKMRQTGLENDGIFSPENLAFKMLRNSGYLEKLSSLRIEAYDKMMSLNLESKTNIDFSKSWKEYLK